MSVRTLYRFRGGVPPTGTVRASVLTPELDDTAESAVMRLYDPIDSWGGDWGVSAKEFVAALSNLPDEVREIRLHINSPGGEVYEGLAIMNTLRAHRARVVAVVDGLAASAASFIAAGADELVMARNSQLMIHDAWGLGMGNASVMRDLADRLDKISNNIADVYATKAGGSVEQWRTAMLAETWYNDAEAVAAGLADSVAELPVQPKDSFDLAVFRYQGRESAPAPTTTRDAQEACDPRVERMNQRRRARHEQHANA